MAEHTIALIGASASVARALVPLLVTRAAGKVRLFNRSPGAISGQSFEPLPRSASDLAGVDAVVHLAGIVQAADESLFQVANVDLPVKMARLARDAGVARFVFLSSLSVHGHWSPEPYTPEMPFAPMTPYGASKAAAEDGLKRCLDGSGSRLSILRPPLVYGSGLKTKFGAFVRAARVGAPLPIGRARARRSMVSQTNLTDAVLHMCAHDAASGSPAVLLPADDRDLMVSEIYAALCELSGKSTWQIPAPLWAMHGALRMFGREGVYDSLFRPAVIDRAHWRDLGWAPPGTVEQGLHASVVG